MQNKATTKFLILLTVIVTLIIFAFSLGNYFLQRFQLDRQSDIFVEGVLTTLSTDLSEPLWNLDQPTVNEIGVRYKTTKNISRLQVYDNYKNLLISLGELDENSEYRFSSHEVLYDGQNVGMIQLGIDNSQINFARSMSLKLSILLTIIIVLTVTSTSYFLTRKLVLKPFEEIEEERKSLKQQVIETKKFKQAVESSADGVIITDENSIILFVNAAWEKITGYNFADVKGLTPKILQSGKTPRSVYKKMWAHLKSGKAFISEDFINKRKDGEEYQVRSALYPLREKNKTLFYVGVHQDITERKELDKVKTEFVSLASHQLRTPLTEMKWSTEILLDNESKNLKAEQIRIIKQLSHSSEDMISLVNDLLYSSEVESEIVLGAKSPGCVVEILEKCLKKSKSMAEEKKIKFKIQYPKVKCVKIMINPVLVKKVIQEVINNAIDYSRDRGEVRINVKKNKKDITIIVADDGIGIPRLQQSRIFSKLFRASNAFKVKTHGNGLSLFIAKTIMKKIKGSLDFKSKENKCTTFTIKIPTK